MSVALRAIIVMPILLLQKPRKNSKLKEHSACLEKRLALWLDGNLKDLLVEGRVIQDRLVRNRAPVYNSDLKLTKTFTKLMFEGRTHAALNLLSDGGRGSPLSLDEPADQANKSGKTVREVLKEKVCLYLPVQLFVKGSLLKPIL